MSRFVDHMAKTASEVESFLASFLGGFGLMSEEAAYSVLGGGKRFRPALSMIFAEGIGGEARLDVLRAACAVELTHCFSLVHDDLPEMDDDSERRGKPSCHVRFGHAGALLCGDWLSSAAFSMASSLSSPESSSYVCGLLSECSMRMIEGQLLEMRTPSPDAGSLLRIHSLKTGALIRCAVFAGARIAGGASALEGLLPYAESLGLLFQISDDLLDAGDGEANLASVLGMKACLDLAGSVADRARKAAARYGRHEELLVSAVDFLIERTV